MKAILLGISLAFGLFILLLAILRMMNAFFDNHYLQFNSIIEIKLNWPVSVKERVKEIKKKAQVPSFVQTVHASDTVPHIPQGVMTDKEIVAYIRSKDWNSHIAIPLAKSENFWNYDKHFHCDRVGARNSNGTYDYGLFQINEIHRAALARYGWTMEDMKDCKKNIDFAYEWVYKGSGWGAWSAYNNRSYLGHDESIL